MLAPFAGAARPASVRSDALEDKRVVAGGPALF
jgi:hypothetical protein